MPKVKVRKSKKTTSKALEPTVLELKTEDTETELTSTAEPQFQPIHLVHFDELNCIWPNDPRIPSVKSRRAWALARNLNPTNVHSWWYRRRKVAAKSKIIIPKDIYELDVGTPPELPIVKEEPHTTAALLASDSTVDDGTAGFDNECAVTSGTIEGLASSDADLLCADSSGSSLTAFSEALHVRKSSPALNDVSKGAYIHSSPSKHEILFCDYLMQHSDAINLPRNSSLPPSSPPPLSPAPSHLSSPVNEMPVLNRLAKPPLILDEAPTLEECTERFTDRDAFWASFALREPLYPAEFLPTRASGVPFSSCAYTPFSKLKNLENKSLLPCLNDTQPLEDLDSEFAPWCIDGFRVCFDGSLLGVCSCCFPSLDTSVNDA